MNTAFLLTGGNLGDRSPNLKKASDAIQQHCGVIKQRSFIYQTAAWGFTNQPDFYNQALQIQTALNADELMKTLLEIEKILGRERDIKMGPRIIDIDILLMNDLVYQSEIVIIPHPHLTERRFALTPLAEIAGEIIHPVLHKTIKELLAECKDELPVYKISANE
jgi:2-amino-4-hydroxy-6-hydroxymethyldihydropteridine diphosphokinase